MIRRSRRFSEARRMSTRRFREAEEHEYTFLLCLSCNKFKYKNDLFTEKMVKAENLAEAVDTLQDLLNKRCNVRGSLDDVVEYFTEIEESHGYKPDSDEDLADFLVSESGDGDIDPCYLGIMKDGKILGECLYEYIEGYDPDFQVIYLRSLIQKIKRGTLNLDKWGHSLSSVQWNLEDAMDQAEEY